MSQTIQQVDFHGQSVTCLETPEGVFVALRPICENLGLSWSKQSERIKAEAGRLGCALKCTPSAGGEQMTLCLPLKKLNGWLFSINPNKVRPDLKDRLIQYQEECFEVLYNYWFHGEALNPRMGEEREDWSHEHILALIREQRLGSDFAAGVLVSIGVSPIAKGRVPVGKLRVRPESEVRILELWTELVESGRLAQLHDPALNEYYPGGINIPVSVLQGVLLPAIGKAKGWQTKVVAKNNYGNIRSYCFPPLEKLKEELMRFKAGWG